MKNSEVNICRSCQRGFTLIEIVIVTAILAILATVALQAYQDQAERAANHACLGEAKNYANFALTALHDPNSEMPDTFEAHACESIEWEEHNINTPILAWAREPGNASITCRMDTSATCHIDEE